MPLTLDNTLSGDKANSYVDVAYADSYWSGHYTLASQTAWTALTTNQKTSALIAATRVLETVKFTERKVNYFDYKYFYDRIAGVARPVYDEPTIPVKYDWYQALQFPRNLDVDKTTGASYIIEPVKMAQCEQALYMTTVDSTALVNTMQGLISDSIKVGNISIRQKFSESKVGTLLSPNALQILSPYMIRSGAVLRRS